MIPRAMVTPCLLLHLLALLKCGSLSGIAFSTDHTHVFALFTQLSCVWFLTHSYSLCVIHSALIAHSVFEKPHNLTIFENNVLKSERKYTFRIWGRQAGACHRRRAPAEVIFWEFSENWIGLTPGGRRYLTGGRLQRFCNYSRTFC